MQILKKYKKWNPILEIDKSNVMDFAISNVNKCELDEKIMPISLIDISDFRCIDGDTILSKIENIWDEYIISHIPLKNIAFTGIDNGLININSDFINNEQFLEILKNTTYSLSDSRLMLKPINSNTNTYSTDYEIIQGDESFIKLNGGGFQGFFKTSDANR